MPADYNERRKLLVEFGERLRRARESRSLSQEELAYRTGLHRTEISLVERGLRGPRLCTLVLLIAELGISATVLLDSLPTPSRVHNCDERPTS